MYVSYFEGLSCPVCNNPFVSDDDIVVCPQCGLPHHRECWKSIGQCFEHAKHGTSQQWSRDNHTSNTAPSSATTSASDMNAVRSVMPKMHAMQNFAVDAVTSCLPMIGTALPNRRHLYRSMHRIALRLVPMAIRQMRKSMALLLKI